MAHGLKAPKNLQITLAPSERQYEVWKNLQPECPYCGGEVVQQQSGFDRNGHPTYTSVCSKCGNDNIPQMILCGGAAGGGKAGLLDSTVCTPFGFRKVRDLKEGDIITSATTGKQQRIIKVHPIGIFDFYRFHFADGTHFDCSAGHLWQYHQSRKCSKKLDENGNQIKDRVDEACKLYEWMQRKKQGMYKGSNLIIPLCEPVQFTHPKSQKSKKPIAPYVLGALIGDGCFTDSMYKLNRVELTTMDAEIISRF